MGNTAPHSPLESKRAQAPPSTPLLAASNGRAPLAKVGRPILEGRRKESTSSEATTTASATLVYPSQKVVITRTTLNDIEGYAGYRGRPSSVRRSSSSNSVPTSVEMTKEVSIPLHQDVTGEATEEKEENGDKERQALNEDERVELFHVSSLTRPICGSPLTDVGGSSLASSSLHSGGTSQDVSSFMKGRLANGRSSSGQDSFTTTTTTTTHTSLATVHEGLASPSSAEQEKETGEEEEQKVPVFIAWTSGGVQVYFAGSFNQWRERIPLVKGKDEHSLCLELNPGTVQFKFEVDGEWKCSNDYDTALDGQGNLVNYLRVEKEEDDIMEILSSAVSSVSFGGVANRKEITFGQTVPDYLTQHQLPSASSMDTSTRDAYLRSLSSSDYFQDSPTSFPPVETQPLASVLTDPPACLPPHFEQIILNQGGGHEVLPVPHHVSLDHAYALSMRDGIMGLATTVRYRTKYVTYMLYRPVQDDPIMDDVK